MKHILILIFISVLTIVGCYSCNGNSTNASNLNDNVNDGWVYYGAPDNRTRVYGKFIHGRFVVVSTTNAHGASISIN